MAAPFTASAPRNEVVRLRQARAVADRAPSPDLIAMAKRREAGIGEQKSKKYGQDGTTRSAMMRSFPGQLTLI